MDEHTLLVCCVLTAVLGLIGLHFVPTIPQTETVGTLVWKNDTSALILQTTSQFVELNKPTNLRVGTCVTIQGVLSNDRFTSTTISQSSPQDRRHCP